MTDDIKTQSKKLPDKPGVYLFFDKHKKLVYVGKATSLKSRVKSYFAGQRSARPVEEMIGEVVNIKYEVTDSVLEAVILEANYIKKFQPKYNVLGKDDKSWNYIVITKDIYPRVNFVRQHDLNLWQQNKSPEFKNIADSFGPYPGINARAALKIFRKIFFISDCVVGQKRPCLYYEMKQCLGVCTGEISSRDYKRKVIMPLKKFLRGGKKQVIVGLKKDMRVSAKAQDFEEAGRLRNQITALQKIADATLINKNFFIDGFKKSNIVHRIEAYDISNMGSYEKVGSMVVFDEVGPVKAEYRKFNIKTVVGQSDVDCLREVLIRRLKHYDWDTPQVILIDGGVPQVNAVKEMIFKYNPDMWLLGIAKGPKRDKNEFILATKNPNFTAWVKDNKNLLVMARDEAHRFAISFHRSKRKLF